jgi:hypothetical protein
LGQFWSVLSSASVGTTDRGAGDLVPPKHSTRSGAPARASALRYQRKARSRLHLVHWARCAYAWRVRSTWAAPRSASGTWAAAATRAFPTASLGWPRVRLAVAMMDATAWPTVRPAEGLCSSGASGSDGAGLRVEGGGLCGGAYRLR